MTDTRKALEAATEGKPLWRVGLVGALLAIWLSLCICGLLALCVGAMWLAVMLLGPSNGVFLFLGVITISAIAAFGAEDAIETHKREAAIAAAIAALKPGE